MKTLTIYRERKPKNLPEKILSFCGKRFKKNHKIKIYSSAKEMSIGRYAEFQKYLVIDAGIENLQSSLNRTKAFIQEQKFEDADVEINNSIVALSSVVNSVGVLTYAFAVIVSEIGSKVACDTTIDGLNSVIEQLKALNISQLEIEMCIEELKKKISEEIEKMFPEFIDTTSTMLFFSKMKRYLLLASSMYANDYIPCDEDKIELRSLRNWFFIKDKAKSILEVGFDIERNFLSLLSLLELDRNCDILTFYSKLDYINKKNAKASA